MFNMYQTLNKKGNDENGENNSETIGIHRNSEVTGHDRFYQERLRPRRNKKRRGSRRSNSAIEFDTDAMLFVRNTCVKKRRSSSISSTLSNNDNERFQFANKIDNLTKLLFNRMSVAKTNRQSEVSRRRAWKTTRNIHHRQTYNSCINCLIRFCQRFQLITSRLDATEYLNEYSRRNNRSYESLDQSSTTHDDEGEYLELKSRTRSHRKSICDVYIEESARYNLIKQLHDVGSRVDKYWTIVGDKLLKTNRLLTLTPLSKNGPLNICPTTKDVLNKLFLALQHPYICPVLDIEFIEFNAVYHVMLVQPINQGSLKDLIYGVGRNGWNADWDLKYASRGKGLLLRQIQQMGRQILEALIFLKARGFPTVTHLHSGNVVIQNGVARITGLENTLLGFNSRIYPIIASRLTDNNAIDSICFGHMLFEMAAGYELRSFKPSETHYEDIAEYPQVVNLIKFIFNQQNCYPTIKELIMQDLFRNIELREMRYIPVDMFRPVLTPSVINLLEGIRRHTSSKSEMQTPIIAEVNSR